MAEQADAAATPVARPDDGAANQAKAFRESADSIRRRADLAAKTFGGLATTAVSGIGIAKFADIFPLPPGEWPWLIGLIGGFGLMLVVVGIFTVRLWRVSEPMVLRSSVGAMGDDLRDDEEKEIVRRLYQEVADLNQAPSLRAYEARAHRLLRIADRIDDTRATKLALKASAIVGDIVATETRALMVIARRRATHAVGDKKAILAYAAFIVGIAGFGISADRFDSERKGAVDVAKACADANTAGAVNLPRICGTFTVAPADTPAAARTQVLKDLGTALGRCEAARTDRTGEDPCAPIQNALAAAMGP
jgi:hypothetical protein